jgi:hypothetical protein
MVLQQRATEAGLGAVAEDIGAGAETIASNAALPVYARIPASGQEGRWELPATG